MRRDPGRSLHPALAGASSQPMAGASRQGTARGTQPTAGASRRGTARGTAYCPFLSVMFQWVWEAQRYQGRYHGRSLRPPSPGPRLHAPLASLSLPRAAPSGGSTAPSWPVLPAPSRGSPNGQKFGGLPFKSFSPIFLELLLLLPPLSLKPLSSIVVDILKLEIFLPFP